MATEFKMPQLGLTMTEGGISKWLKNVGDTIAVGDLLVEVETDKIVNQVEATAAGTLLAILVPEGSSAPVQSVLALIGNAGEKLDAAAPAAPATEAAAPAHPAEVPAVPTAKPLADGERLKASPIAKKMAAELGVDLTVVTGTGPGGRIKERDVADYSQRNPGKASPLASKLANEMGVDLAKIEKDSRIMKADVLAFASNAGHAAQASMASEGVPVSGMRKVIAERMSQSWHTSPHVNMTAEVDMTEASALRASLSAIEKKKISFTEIIVKCAARALSEHKTLNASFIDGKSYLHESVNVGIAVALDNGLIVPVIRNAPHKSVGALHDEIAELGQKARQGTLKQEEYQGGTFTVTNLGMFGVDHFTPIINQPESAILGVCRVVERAVVVDGAIVIRPMMNLCLSFDHRMIDGAVGAKFLKRIRQLLEQPLLLV